MVEFNPNVNDVSQKAAELKPGVKQEEGVGDKIKDKAISIFEDVTLIDDYAKAMNTVLEGGSLNIGDAVDAVKDNIKDVIGPFVGAEKAAKAAKDAIVDHFKKEE